MLVGSPSRKLYFDSALLFKVTQRPPQTLVVTDADMETDCDAARSKMEVQLLEAFTVEQLNKHYRKKALRQMKSVGGMTITAVDGKGDRSFAYTCGFTQVGGKELLLQNVHRSMTNDVASLFNFLYKRHNDGHPLGHGHMISSGNGIVCAVVAPNKIEAVLLKASKTLQPTRLYGLAGYDLLLIVPVGSRSDSGEEGAEDYETREEALLLQAGLGINGFKPTKEGDRPLEVCAWCHEMTKDTGARLAKCSGCKKEYYCSPEHQKLDWKKHKVFCRRSNEESFNIAMKPFVGNK